MSSLRYLKFGTEIKSIYQVSFFLLKVSISYENFTEISEGESTSKIVYEIF